MKRMNKLAAIGAISILGVTVLAGCSSSDNTTANATTEETSAEATTEANADIVLYFAEETYSQLGKLVQADSALNQAVSVDTTYDGSAFTVAVGYAADMPTNVDAFAVAAGAVTTTMGDGVTCSGLTNDGIGQMSGDIVGVLPKVTQ